MPTRESLIDEIHRAYLQGLLHYTRSTNQETILIFLDSTTEAQSKQVWNYIVKKYEHIIRRMYHVGGRAIRIEYLSNGQL